MLNWRWRIVQDDLNRLLFEEVFEISNWLGRTSRFLSRVASGNIRIPSKKVRTGRHSWTKNTDTRHRVDGKLKKIMWSQAISKTAPAASHGLHVQSGINQMGGERLAVPTITMTSLEAFKRNSELYLQEALKAGHKLELGPEPFHAADYSVFGESR